MMFLWSLYKFAVSGLALFACYSVKMAGTEMVKMALLDNIKNETINK